MFQLAARAARIQANKAISLFAVGISRHDGDLLLLDQHFLQRPIVNIQRAQVNPGQIGCFGRLPVQLRKGAVYLLRDIQQILFQITPQGIQPRRSLLIGGNMRRQRQHGRRRESVPAF